MPREMPAAIGRYKVIRALGEGGMGAVFLARDPEIDRLLAIKLMSQRFDAGQLRDRFRREAKAIGRLHHPNIVVIFDVGEHDGEPFIAMEYVEGQTLANLIGRTPDLPLARKLGFIEGLCAGLHYAHKHGIIHRDIKPANVMVDAEGRVKILDFGIARGMAGSQQASPTQPGTLIGSLNYMSPEQLLGRQVDPRSDIFAFGAVFYELLCGQPAFPGDLRDGLFSRLINEPPPALRTLCPGLDSQVIAVVDRCLEKDPARRFADLDGVRLALVQFRGGRDASAPDGDRTIPLPTPIPRDLRTPAPRTPKGPNEEILRQRRAIIDQHLAHARTALEREDFPSVIAACREALLLEPDNVDAATIQDRAESLVQARECLKEAHGHLDRGALTAAALLVDRALELEPTLSDAIKAREAVESARQSLEERERRAVALHDALAKARGHLYAGELEAASAAIAEVQALDADPADVAVLRQELATRTEASRRAAEERRIREAIATAQRQFAAGQPDAAIAGLSAFAPQNTQIMQVRSALEAELRDLRRREEEARRRREDEEARKRREDDEARKRREDEEARKRREDDEARKRRDDDNARERRDDDDARKRRDDEDARRRDEEFARQLEQAAKEKALERAKEKERDGDKETANVPPRNEEDTIRFQKGQFGTRPSDTVRQPGPSDTVLITPPSQDVTIPLRGRSVLPPPEPVAPPVTRRPVPIGVVLGGLGVLVAAGVGLTLWLGGDKGAGPATAGTATVSFDIRPWARLESVTNKAGQRIDVICPATPCLVSLPPGEYHVRARNPFFPTPVEFDVTVGPGEFKEARHVLPSLKPDEDAARILGGR